MKFRLFAMLTLFSMAGTTLFGQDLAGTWQGTATTPGGPMRLVLRINRAVDGKHAGQAFSIDQREGAGQPIPLNELSVEGSSVKWKLGSLAGYEGSFTADGNAINGTLTQGPNPMALNLNRATPQTAWAIPEPPAPPKAMDPAADPGIEVATVKPIQVESRGRSLGFRGSTLTAINYSVLHAITFAYDLHERQVSGAPAWISTDRFEIVIKTDTPGQPNPQQIRRLLQKVLADRFQLKFHGEKRELSVYAITQLPNTKHKMTDPASGENLPTLRFSALGTLPARNATMMGLSQALQGSVVDRPVINLTNLEGRFDFTLEWMPDEFQFEGRAAQLPDNGKPNLFRAFQEQLGLKLEATKAQADVVVIDTVERPSEN